MIWSERIIGRAVSRQLFSNSALVMVPNCSWTGHECDVLVVEKGLRIIDIEVKISRSDLKADLKKEKWWERRSQYWVVEGPPAPDMRRQWPLQVWKHYYAMPKSIWTPELLSDLPPASGILLLEEKSTAYNVSGPLGIRVERAAKPCRDADKLSPASVLDIARLASLRMWDAYAEIENLTATCQTLSESITVSGSHNPAPITQEIQHEPSL